MTDQTYCDFFFFFVVSFYLIIFLNQACNSFGCIVITTHEDSVPAPILPRRPLKQKSLAITCANVTHEFPKRNWKWELWKMALSSTLDLLWKNKFLPSGEPTFLDNNKTTSAWNFFYTMRLHCSSVKPTHFGPYYWDKSTLNTSWTSGFCDGATWETGTPARIVPPPSTHISHFESGLQNILIIVTYYIIDSDVWW